VTQPADIGVLGDPTAGTVAGATSAAQAYYMSHEAKTHPQGSELGTVLAVGMPPLDPAAAPGEAEPSGAYYDPPRGY